MLAHGSPAARCSGRRHAALHVHELANPMSPIPLRAVEDVIERSVSLMYEGFSAERVSIFLVDRANLVDGSPQLIMKVRACARA